MMTTSAHLGGGTQFLALSGVCNVAFMTNVEQWSFIETVSPSLC